MVVAVSSNKLVLVVEDEAEIRDLISLHILRMGLQVQQASTAEEALEHLNKIQPQLIVLDWMLPQMSGLEFLQNIRQTQKDLPVLMVTAKAESQDIVAGLEAGADDYITKPFEPQVLVARMRALIRRMELKSEIKEVKNQIPSILKVGNLVINNETFEVHCGSEKLHLTPSEFKLLTTMVMNSGKVLTRDRLVEEIQGEGISVVGRTIDTHIFGLRKKLGECNDCIETIRGIGYRVKSFE